MHFLVKNSSDSLVILNADGSQRYVSPAAERITEQPHEFDAVITDQTMPGMTGTDLARKMLQIWPDIPIILCTGYSNLVDEGQAKSLGIKGFAIKPVTKKEIATLLRKVLNED